ncbi:MAG TPA: protein kinase [Nitrospiraceae bacterium]|nr:protein kinase [Nitrospiraceae bacterium]
MDYYKLYTAVRSSDERHLGGDEEYYPTVYKNHVDVLKEALALQYFDAGSYVFVEDTSVHPSIGHLNLILVFVGNYAIYSRIVYSRDSRWYIKSGEGTDDAEGPYGSIHALVGFYKENPIKGVAGGVKLNKEIERARFKYNDDSRRLADYAATENYVDALVELTLKYQSGIKVSSNILDEGKFGEVLLVTKETAIKKLKKEEENSSENNTRPVGDEYKILLGMLHINIIQIFGIVSSPEEDDMSVMRYINNSKNIAFVAAQMNNDDKTPTTTMYKKLNLQRRKMWLIYQLVGAIQYLHMNKVYHLDIHTGNVLVQYVDTLDRVKVIDFNLSYSGRGVGAPSGLEKSVPYTISCMCVSPKQERAILDQVDSGVNMAVVMNKLSLEEKEDMDKFGAAILMFTIISGGLVEPTRQPKSPILRRVHTEYTNEEGAPMTPEVLNGAMLGKTIPSMIEKIIAAIFIKYTYIDSDLKDLAYITINRLCYLMTQHDTNNV